MEPYAKERRRKELEDIKELYKKGRKEWLEGNHLDALDTYLSITRKGHGYCGANMNAAVILTSLGRRAEAEAHFREAFATCPTDKDLLFNYSLHLLSRGELKEGLRLYENRTWNIRPPGAEWDGSRCKTLLIVPEQGNGDLIQFARFLPEARKRCDKLIVMCFGSLVRLFRSFGAADEIIEFNPGDEFVESEAQESGENVPYDRFARIMSLPHLLGIEDVDPRPYLKADEELRLKWASKMQGDRIKVGLCWRGKRREKEDSAAIDMRRSVSLETIEPIFEVAGAEFYSLQKDPEEKDKRMNWAIDESRDFADTAAIIENLDLVITVDTAVAHVAGAIGKPTWILNRFDSCWRWGNSGESTVWYQNTRLFRQERMMEWGPVVKRVVRELEKYVDDRHVS